MIANGHFLSFKFGLLVLCEAAVLVPANRWRSFEPTLSSRLSMALHTQNVTLVDIVTKIFCACCASA
uniref:Putative secreted peptide n=1 Tax=Anopheles braziliensis TaxID=58242 RepID=A0A2M3ZXL5_9DIPT